MVNVLGHRLLCMGLVALLVTAPAHAQFGNVIAHEIGHSIGLGHNSDATKLMCGRPAPCRPDAFSSAAPKLFPPTDKEKRQLRAMYPADWKPRAP